MTIIRTAINPTGWSVGYGYNQGEVVTGQTRTLYISGQAAMSAEGEPIHDGDLRGQLAAALENLGAVLAGADMTAADLVSLRVHTTDVDALFAEYEVMGAWLGQAGAMPTLTIVQVARLVFPSLLVEIEGVAVA